LLNAAVHPADIQDRDGAAAWISRNRRLARDFERYARNVQGGMLRFLSAGVLLL
jgi:hypothetical protein